MASPSIKNMLPKEDLHKYIVWSWARWATYYHRVPVVSFNDKLLTMVNDFLHHICRHVHVKLPDRGDARFADIDSALPDTQVDVVEPLKKRAMECGEACIMSYLRRGERNSIYAHGTHRLDRMMRITYGVTLSNKVVGVYLSGVLGGFARGLIDTLVKGLMRVHGVDDRNRLDVTMSMCEEALRADEEVEAVFDAIGFDETVYYSGGSGSVRSATVSASVQPPEARLPIIYEYEEAAITRKKLFAMYRGGWAPGDVFYPLDVCYRSNGIYMINASNEPDYITQMNNADGFIPPWAVTRLLDQGYDMKQIIESYQGSGARFLVYPRAFQPGGHLIRVHEFGNDADDDIDPTLFDEETLAKLFA